MLPSKKQKHKTKIRTGENPQFIESFLLHRVNPEEGNKYKQRNGMRTRFYANANATFLFSFIKKRPILYLNDCINHLVCFYLLLLLVLHWHRTHVSIVNSMGLRVRVYGCERMRRERLIGESIVSFATIDLELETNLWLPLEPRANATVSTFIHSIICTV